MRKKILFSLGVMGFTVVTGCAAIPQGFNDTDVHFTMINHQSMNGDELYTVQVKSTSSVELTHLTMYLSYPIKTPTGTKSNPFLLKGITRKQIVNLENDQSVQLTFYAPIKDVFGDSKLLDLRHPVIELDGFTKDGDKETPFGLSGDLRLYLSQHK